MSRRVDVANLVFQVVLLIVVIVWTVHTNKELREIQRHIDDLDRRTHQLERHLVEVDQQLDEIERWQQKQDSKI